MIRIFDLPVPSFIIIDLMVIVTLFFRHVCVNSHNT